MGHIFAVPNHIQLIKDGAKTQTRRLEKPGTNYVADDNGNIIEVWQNGRLQYKVGRTYRGSPGRGKRGEVSYRITAIRCVPSNVISPEDALAEGGYTPESYLELLSGLYPSLPPFVIAYTFEVVR